ncbi:disintegrin and metalloproteinase domain-containing protein 20-like [Rhynchocyon petersi]
MGPTWAKGQLVLCTLLSSVCCSHVPPGWCFTSSEIVIPRKMPDRRTGAQRTGQLSYSMRFQGRRYIVHMKVKKSLLPRHFPVITNNDQGAMQEDYPFVPRDCYYLSYLEGVPGSRATLDTCYGGLHGMLQVDDLTYEIKPLETSSKFEHVVSLLVSEENLKEVERCTVEKEDTNQALEEEQLGESPRAGASYMWVPHMKKLKLHYTVSNSLYLQNPNMTNIIENIVIMNNILDSIYQFVHLNVFIRVLCIWNTKDVVRLGEGSAYHIIEDFGLWKQRSWYNEIKHDTSLLLTGHLLGTRNYYSFNNAVCNANWGVTYVQVKDLHIFLASTVSAHALGHSFGVPHDRAGCYCFRRSSCVMAPEPGLLDSMGNCSFAQFFLKMNGWDPCLSEDIIAYHNFPYIAARCGNKIVDQGEECDCGSFKECSEDKCCSTNCVMPIGSLCDEGDCCHECKFVLPGRICRDIRGICDLPEYCDGKTHMCPEDTYVQDGTPCSPLAVCVRGNCSGRDMQCQALFGYGIKDGPPACYKKLNMIGDRFGNCGGFVSRGGLRNIKCEADDVFCGLLHCGGMKEVPGGGDHYTFRDIIVFDVKEESCFGYDFHPTAGKPPVGLVVDGATCGPGRYCLEQNCTYFQDLNFTCNVSKCNYRGVCNNKDNCHCLRGWKPPFCAEAGGGGSIDSGPPPNREEELQFSIHININKKLLVIFSRLILFLCSFITGALSQLQNVLVTRSH